MSPQCSLCKGRNPPRTHVFPQKSRADVQVKWVKAMSVPQEKENEILAEMRELEEKGNRPRWCTFHFEYDEAGIHFPKYFDPEDGKAAQGWAQEETSEDNKDEEHDLSHDQSNEPRRSSRKRSAPARDSVSSSSDSYFMDKSIEKILIEAGCIAPPGEEKKSESPMSSPAGKKGAATSAEKTLQSILMDAGLPVPMTLQAKTGLVVDDGSDDGNVHAFAQTRRLRPSQRVAEAIRNGAPSVADAKRMGTFVPGQARGGATLSNPPRLLLNPMNAQYAMGERPRVIMPKPVGSKAYCYNPNTMEKYDDNDSLRQFKMPCKNNDCRSELTVIMNRARALEEQFDDLTRSVNHLVMLYKTKAPIAYRPQQSLATIQGRVASVNGPVYGRSAPSRNAINPDSLSVQERRVKRDLKKEPQRLLTDDDLASTVRRRVSGSSAVKQEEPDYDDEEEAAEMDDEDDDDYRPSPAKKPRRAGGRGADTSEESPPMLDMAQ